MSIGRVHEDPLSLETYFIGGKIAFWNGDNVTLKLWIASVNLGYATFFISGDYLRFRPEAPRESEDELGDEEVFPNITVDGVAVPPSGVCLIVGQEISWYPSKADDNMRTFTMRKWQVR